MARASDTLEKVKNKAKQSQGEQSPDVKTRIIVGTATCGIAAGAAEVVEALKREIKERGIKGAVVSETGCTGRCDLEPLVQVQIDGEPPVLYHHIDTEKAKRIVRQHIQTGEIIEDWVVS